MEVPLKHMVVDYFPHFSCLAGECGYTCCYGWSVGLEHEEYLAVQVLRAAPAMRKKLEQSFEPPQDPSSPFFAQIALDSHGFCPFLGKDRLCTLQQQCGEGALSNVCKSFPRSANLSGVQWEQVCSAACEQVVNLLLQRPQGIKLVEQHTADTAYIQQQVRDDAYAARPALKLYQPIQKLFMGILQNRRYPIHHRVLMLGLAAQKLNDVHTLHQATVFLQSSQWMLAHSQGVEQRLAHLQKDEEELVLMALTHLHYLRQGSQARDAFFARLVGAVHENLGVVCRPLPDGAVEIGVDMGLYQQAKEKFGKFFQTSYLMENLLVNLMLYMQFPLNWLDDQTPVWHHYLDFYLQYNIYKVLFVGYMADKAEISPLVQGVAAAFRNVTHNTLFRQNLVQCILQDSESSPAHLAKQRQVMGL